MSDKCLQNGVLFLSCRSMHLQWIQHIQMGFHLPWFKISLAHQISLALMIYTKMHKTALEYTADVTVANTRFRSCRKHFKPGDMSLQGSFSLC